MGSSEESHSVRGKLDVLHTQLELQGQKLDFLVNSFTEERTERKAACVRHSHRINVLESWRTFLLGAWAVGFTLLWEKIRRRMGL